MVPSVATQSKGVNGQNKYINKVKEIGDQRRKEIKRDEFSIS